MMPRTIWTKLQSEPNGTWSRHEGEPPFSILATPGLAHDVLTDTGESFVITPLEVTSTSVLSVTRNGPDSILVTSSEAGTLYYGFYPAGTPVGSISAAAMIAGNDTNQISNGSAGVFVAAGVLEDVQIPFFGLTGETDYTLAIVLNIEDGGTYTNIATEDYTTPELSLAYVLAAATNVAGDQIILTVSESVMGTEDTADWVVNGVTGGSATVDAVTISGTTITLDLSDNLVASGDSPTVDYAGGDIEDAAGNALADFTNQAVTNNVPASGVTVTYLGEAIEADNAGTTYTFTGISLGSNEVWDREIFVITQFYGTTFTLTDGVTIGGVTAPDVVRAGSADISLFINAVSVPTGTTADIVVNLNGALDGEGTEGMKISVYEVIGRTSTVATWKEQRVSAPPEQANDFNVELGDAILGAAGATGSNPVTLVGVTLDGTLWDSDVSDHIRAGSIDGLAADATYTVSMTGGTRQTAAFVQLR